MQFIQKLLKENKLIGYYAFSKKMKNANRLRYSDSDIEGFYGDYVNRIKKQRKVKIVNFKPKFMSKNEIEVFTKHGEGKDISNYQRSQYFRFKYGSKKLKQEKGLFNEERILKERGNLTMQG